MRLLRLGLSIAALASLPQPELQRFEAVEPHMGTLVRVTVYTRDEQAARDAFRGAFDRIRVLDEILSDYRPDSELNRITRTAVGRPVQVSEDLFAVLRASQDLAEATGGAFDVTQGPVIRLWREARKTGRLPGPAALQEAAGRSGYRKLHLDDGHRTVRLEVAGMALDVGAIGKGYAASEALEALGGLGVGSALVAVSGDLAFSDAPPGRRGWRISVQSGDRPLAGVPAVLELTNAAVSTAGSNEQHVDIGGHRYSHIIDPSSRTGLVNDISVTVITRHGLEADGLDTAVSVLGADRGLAFIESRPDAAALIIERTSEGTRVLPSSRFLGLAAEHSAETQKVGAGTVAARPPAPDLASRIDAIAQQSLEQPNAGISIAVARDGRVVFARGYGLADRARRVPVTDATVFHVASISKNIAAAAVLSLADQGRLLGISEQPLRDLPPPKDELAAISGLFDSDEGGVELLPCGDRLCYQLPGANGHQAPLKRQAPFVYAIDRDTETRFVLRNGRVDWTLVYTAGLMTDAKRRVRPGA